MILLVIEYEFYFVHGESFSFKKGLVQEGTEKLSHLAVSEHQSAQCHILKMSWNVIQNFQQDHNVCFSLSSLYYIVIPL